MMPPRPPRLPDWPERLAALLASKRAARFAWGRNDCAMFAADVVHALTGWDPAANLRGKYADQSAAQALIADAGGLGELAARLLEPRGITELPPLFAQRGDVVLVELQGVQALAVVTTDGVMALGPAGVHSLPLSAVQRAWAV